jgi:hypothetical protein
VTVLFFAYPNCSPLPFSSIEKDTVIVAERSVIFKVHDCLYTEREAVLSMCHADSFSGKGGFLDRNACYDRFLADSHY